MFIFFFFNDTATTEIYTLSLHDALPIYELTCLQSHRILPHKVLDDMRMLFDLFLHEHNNLPEIHGSFNRDRKSTRLNSSHLGISYAVFCLKKKKKKSRGLTRSVIH